LASDLSLFISWGAEFLRDGVDVVVLLGNAVDATAASPLDDPILI
jgi:hypothetical protein